MANVSKLLHTTTDPETFLANLTVEDDDLKAAKRKIRGHLRLAFAVASRAEFDMEVQPRFFTQGSSSYRTLNDPAWPPGQQRDLDDGCYLPLSFVKGERPSKAAEQFFAFVDRVLGELAGDEGWELIQKPTCVRLVIADDAHVDIPLYAIPDHDFALLEARATQDHAMVEKRAPDRWDALPSDKVLLAHRVEGWKSSDPRKIHTWFLKAVDDFGERLRRDCRYLKAWRDHHHLDDDHLSSILLMACAWNAYKAVGEPFLPDREDQRLLRVVELLPAMLREDMANPASQDENLNRMSPEERSRTARAAESLRDRLKEAIEACDTRRRAVDLMRVAFGTRLPDRPDQVSVPVRAEATVAAQPKRYVPAPVVGRSQSG